MKAFNKISVSLYLTICLFFGLYLPAKAQEQVVIKGNSKTTTYEGFIEENLKFVATEIYKIINPTDDHRYLFEDGPTVSSQNFTITYTQGAMHMIGSIEPGPRQRFASDAERNAFNQKNTMTMILRFNPEGTQLDMMILVYGQQPFTMRVPHGNTIASSNRQSLLTPAPISNMEVNGFDAGKYNFYTESELVLKGAVTPTPEGPTPIKLKKIEEGNVWLAPDAPGIELMRRFYLKLALGGYDLAGAEDGGIMTLMGSLLENGMPIRAKEIMTVSTYEAIEGSSSFLFKSVTETDISSVIVEPFNEELLSPPNNSRNSDSSSSSPSRSTINPDDDTESTSGSQTASGTSSSQNESSNDSNSNNNATDECDCSCEKYAEFLKQAENNKKSKKSKNKSEAELIKEINMSCMQDCIMQWTKCMKIKN